MPPVGKSNSDRSFIEFVVEPMYKLLGYTVSEEKEELERFLKTVGIFLKKEHYTYDSKTILKLVCRAFFHKPSCIIDIAVKSFPSPAKSEKFQHNYRGELIGSTVEEVIKAQEKGPLVVDVVKQYHDSECNFFYLFGRVLSGSVKAGQEVAVLGENHRLNTSESQIKGKIDSIYCYNSRYKIEVNEIPAGN